LAEVESFFFFLGTEGCVSFCYIFSPFRHLTFEDRNWVTVNFGLLCFIGYSHVML